jgi:hypothetical protein
VEVLAAAVLAHKAAGQLLQNTGIQPWLEELLAGQVMEARVTMDTSCFSLF